MIIINGCLLHSVTTVLTFGSNSNSLTYTTLSRFVKGYSIMEKIQMVGFFLQEVILSIVYIKEAVRLLKLSQTVHDADVRSFDEHASGHAHLKNASVRKTMYQLLAINVLIIVMDLALLGVEFANLYLIETTLKGVVYSIKLKLEFAVLGKLVQLVRVRNDSSSNEQYSGPERHVTSTGLTLEKTNSGGTAAGQRGGRLGISSLSYDFGNQNLPDFVDPRRVSQDVTHAEPMVNSDEGWETRLRENRERWRRRSRVMRGSWIEEEMDKHNIG
jgi:uncharacterized membrane protein YciS (DUF1049 family)